MSVCVLWEALPGNPLFWRNPCLRSCWTLAHARAVRNYGLVYELAFAPSYPSDARVDDICAYRVKLARATSSRRN